MISMWVAANISKLVNESSAVCLIYLSVSARQPGLIYQYLNGNLSFFWFSSSAFSCILFVCVYLMLNLWPHLPFQLGTLLLNALNTFWNTLTHTHTRSNLELEMFVDFIAKAIEIKVCNLCRVGGGGGGAFLFSNCAVNKWLLIMQMQMVEATSNCQLPHDSSSKGSCR